MTVTTPTFAPSQTTRRPLRPAMVAGVALGVCVLVNVVDPNVEGSIGLCPFKWATGGYDCPGCGVLRGTRALTRGDVVTALDHNVLTTLLMPLLLWGLIGWWRHERGQRATRPQPPYQLGYALAAFVPIWWIGRNLPIFEWFASTAG